MVMLKPELFRVAIDTSEAPAGKPLAASPEPASWPPYADPKQGAPLPVTGDAHDCERRY
jgi:hypothetical protein